MSISPENKEIFKAEVIKIFESIDISEKNVKIEYMLNIVLITGLYNAHSNSKVCETNTLVPNMCSLLVKLQENRTHSYQLSSFSSNDKIVFRLIQVELNKWE